MTNPARLPRPTGLPPWLRVAAYAVVRRLQGTGAGDSREREEVLLTRLAERVTPHELWTLPGGGLEHGEDPRDAVVREVYEETGLHVAVGESARVYSAHLRGVRREGRTVDAHALRIVYEGWVPTDSAPPRVTEVDGSTAEAAWVPVADVHSGALPVVPMVLEALRDSAPFRRQRLAAYAVIRRQLPEGEAVLLTRISGRGFNTGAWTLPGGGVEHGERPAEALRREVREECGVDCVVTGLVDVHDVHFSGTAPDGRFEDFHSVHMIFEARIPDHVEPAVVEAEGTTDAVAFVPLAQIEEGAVEVLDLVRHAMAHVSRR